MNLKLISGSSNIKLASDIASLLGMPLTKNILKRFRDGEIYVQISENIRGDDVFVIQSVSNPVNDNLMELLIIIDALKRASAGRITAVIPYYGYARQDRKSDPREPITAKLVADLLSIAGASRVLVVDLHVPQIQGFFNIPVDEVSAIPLFAEYIKDLSINDPVVVAPDVGATKKARQLAKRLNNCPLAIIDKRRSAHNESDIYNIVGDVEGKTAIIFDDIIDTGNSIVKAVERLSQSTNEVYVLATHGVFSGNAIDILESSAAKQIIITDTIRLSQETKKIKVLSMAKFLSHVIINIHNDKSVSELFN
ncbi:TPA: ribose-phosphate pyrophosphokinase [Candidatus Woesearchaeota archaeon]|nr:ribose-phosphate pyrophosphokinase [Candidatus Woesearchaeota archaeon]HIH32513.1 ribose-phosphate pyrophosphokinase [Candidatus Woesearchaeota archaeon]HIH54151.1 ribose-phosphate pyrophosphokinase [Candidatus Woesearchaeota archaeon]HIJ01696.1 ribose-phosphate pyrophosphokinase [Candidatus Woesearchaeota archaeon]HIJ13264.1 ribose-phosphate pyrophosphokinase [Candidatus Woesearchaeota archaeon]